MANFLFVLLTTATLWTLLIHGLFFLARQLQSNVIEYHTRSLSSFTALVICALYGTVASAMLNITGYGGLGQWTTARSFKWTMLLFTGIWFEIEDPNDYLGTTRPAVFVGNHQTELDVLFLAHAFPKYCSVTAKKSLRWWPFLGWFMWMSKTVFLDRASRAQSVAAFAAAAQQMHSAKQSVYIFPEGTRSYFDHPDLLPFKKGAFHLAVQAQVPIVPIVVANYSNVLNVKKRIFKPGTIPIRVLKPIETKGMGKEDVDKLLEKTRALMLQELKNVTEEARRREVAVQAREASGKHAFGAIKSDAAATGLNAAATT